ncbi:MAG: NADH-quinone oxidoreductase subunit J [candidate division Zixibacteria bacterium]|nr:NADH-quinone oxidoreductase subunit J [candidate division Zixibacteria bacterium]
MGQVIFYILAALVIAAALMVVTRKNAVHSAVYLVVAMCAIAGLFVQLGSVFIAALQIIVYAGAIMVLFLFVIMMLNLKKDEFGFDSRIFQRLFAFILGGIFLIQIVLTATKFVPYRAGRPIDMSIGDIKAISEKLFYVYLYPFEIIGVLLLAAIIGAVVIARRKEEN